MSKKILIIDDESDIVELVKVRLIANGYEVVTAESGLDGISVLQAERPDLIILDVMMPDLDGHTFVRVIKKYEDFRDIPILVFTAKPGLQELFKMEGIGHYLVKPFEAQVFLNKVSELVGPVQE